MNILSKINEKYVPIVLCAGFGTRLKPLTNYIPKVVCPVLDKPIAYRTIEELLNLGFHTVNCNTHYLADIVKNEITSALLKNHFESNSVKFWYEDQILETGGGILRIFQELVKQDSKNIKKDLIVISGDIVSNINIKNMIEAWEQRLNNDLALMYSLPCPSERTDITWISKDFSHVVGFGKNYNNLSGEIPRLFSNHQIISHNALIDLNIEKKSSINLVYQNILNKHKKILHKNYLENNYWFNIGTYGEYNQCISHLSQFENTIKYNDLIINTCSNIPKFIKEKINLLINSHNLNKINFDYKDQIIISFKEKLGFSHEDLFIPLNYIINEIDYNSDHFVLYFPKEH